MLCVKLLNLWSVSTSMKSKQPAATSLSIQDVFQLFCSSGSFFDHMALLIFSKRCKEKRVAKKLQAVYIMTKVKKSESSSAYYPKLSAGLYDELSAKQRQIFYSLRIMQTQVAIIRTNKMKQNKNRPSQLHFHFLLVSNSSVIHFLTRIRATRTVIADTRLRLAVAIEAINSAGQQLSKASVF